jgi:hypothetical protein
MNYGAKFDLGLKKNSGLSLDGIFPFIPGLSPAKSFYLH